MFDWGFRAVDRYGRANSGGLAWRLNHVPRWMIRGIARAKLAGTLRNVWNNSPAQREAWQKAGVKHRHLGKTEVMADIPFLNMDLLRKEPSAFFCVPEEELIHVITTAGTTGQSKKVYFTGDDVRRQTRMIGTNLRRMPGASRVLVVMRTADPTWSAGAFVRRAIEEANLFGMITPNETTTERVCGLIREYGLDVMMSSPSMAHRVTVEAKEDLKALGVKYMILSAQAWTEQLRRELQEKWGAKVLDAYGSNEFGCGLAGECVEQKGLHVPEADFWLEVLDLKTGKPMPDGEEGEIVVTTLSRRGMPLVRYRIGDLGRYLPWEGRCKCGLAVRKIGRIKGRVDDIVMVGTGCNIFPDEFDKALLGTAGVTDYQLVIERESYKDVLHLTVETETRGEALTEAMTKALKGMPYVKIGMEESRLVKIGRVEGVARGVLSKGRPKSQRIIDRRDFTDRY